MPYRANPFFEKRAVHTLHRMADKVPVWTVTCRVLEHLRNRGERSVTRVNGYDRRGGAITAVLVRKMPEKGYLIACQAETADKSFACVPMEHP